MSSSAMIACPRCSAEIRPGMLRCRNCGCGLTESGNMAKPSADSVRLPPGKTSTASSRSLANVDMQDQTCPQCGEQLRPASLRCLCGWRRVTSKSTSADLPQTETARPDMAKPKLNQRETAVPTIQVAAAPAALTNRDSGESESGTKIDRPSAAGVPLDRRSASGLKRPTPRPVNRNTKPKEGSSFDGKVPRGAGTRGAAPTGRKPGSEKLNDGAPPDDDNREDVPGGKGTGSKGAGGCASAAEAEPERKRGTLTWWARRALTRTLATQGSDKPNLAQERRQAIETAALVGDDSIAPLLITALRDEWIIVREAAAVGLGKLRAATAVEPLIERVKSDNSADVRRAAGQALVAIGDSRAVLPLLKLGLEQPPQRLWLSDALARIGSAALPPLLSCLKHPDAGLRLDAVVVLGKSKLKEAAAPLVQAASDPVAIVRAHLAEALGLIGDPRAVPALVKMLDDLDSGVRANAVAALSKMPDERAFDSLLKLLGDENSSVRGFAATTLGAIGNPRAATSIAQLLTDESEDIRLRATEALGELDDPRTADWVLPLLRDEQTPVRLKAAQTLGKTGAESAVGPMLPGLNDPQEQVRKSVVEALGRIGSDVAVSALMVTLSKDRSLEVQLAAVRSLGQIGSPEAIPALREALHSDFAIRCRACVALGEIGSSAAAEILIPLLADPASEIRYHAAVALGTIGDPSALKPLEGLTNDKDPFVLRGVGRALQALGDSRGDKLIEQSRELSASPPQVNLATATVTATTGTTAREIRARRPRTPPLQSLLTIVGSLRESAQQGWQGIEPVNRVKYAGISVSLLLVVTGAWYFLRAPQVNSSLVSALERGNPQSVAFVADDGVAVVTTSGRFEIWDRTSGSMRSTETLEKVHSVIATPDGKSLAVLFDDPRIELRDASGSVLKTITPPGMPAYLEFASQGNALVSAALDGEVNHWTIPAGAGPKRHKFALPQAAVTVAVSPNMKFAAFGMPDGKVMLFNLEDDSEFATIPAHEKAVTSLAFNRDEATLATAGRDGISALWDLVKRQRIANFVGFASGMIFSPDGKRIARATGGGAAITDVDKFVDDPKLGKIIAAGLPMDAVEDVELSALNAFAFDGKFVAGGSTSELELIVWEAATGKAAQVLTTFKR